MARRSTSITPAATHRASRDPFALIADHVLLPFADRLRRRRRRLAQRLTPEVLRDIVGLVPDAWLAGDPAFGRAERRAAYIGYLSARLQAPRAFREEAVRARSQHAMTTR